MKCSGMEQWRRLPNVVNVHWILYSTVIQMGSFYYDCYTAIRKGKAELINVCMKPYTELCHQHQGSGALVEVIK